MICSRSIIVSFGCRIWWNEWAIDRHISGVAVQTKMKRKNEEINWIAWIEIRFLKRFQVSHCGVGVPNWPKPAIQRTVCEAKFRVWVSGWRGKCYVWVWLHLDDLCIYIYIRTKVFGWHLWSGDVRWTQTQDRNWKRLSSSILIDSYVVFCWRWADRPRRRLAVGRFHAPTVADEWQIQRNKFNFLPKGVSGYHLFATWYASGDNSIYATHISRI